MENASLQIDQMLQFIQWRHLPFALGIMVAGWIVMRVVGRFIDDLGERFTDRRLTLKKVKALARFLMYVALAAVVGFSLLDIPDQALLAVAGTLGLGFGFAFKDLFASLMAGVILLFDEPFQVGDRVTFEGFYGEVTEIGLRSVRLVTLDDNLVTVPNSLFLSAAVASANAGALECMVVLPFYIGAAEDFAAAREVVAEAAATSRYAFLERPIVTLVSDEFMGERFVTVVRLKAYVFDARFEKAFASDVTERVKRALRAADIRSPDLQYRDLEMNGRETP